MQISSIMPLFNAEKYLPEALQSLLRQTCNDYELICVNDHSTDKTATILAQFQRTDDRIRILTNEERLGAALSRNKGLRAAAGSYVMFLDGDDIFEEELLEKACGVMEREQVDVVLFEYRHAPSETIYTKRVAEHPGSFIDNFCRRPFSAYDFDSRKFPNWSNAPYDKMFRRSFLMDNRLEFQDLPSSNDVYFAKMSLFCAKKILWLEDMRIMVYVRDHREASRISNDRDPMCVYDAMVKLLFEFKERGMSVRLAKHLYCAVTTNLSDALSREKGEERRERFYRFLHEEGAAKLIASGKEYYEAADAYDKYLLESFRNHACVTGWLHARQTYFQFWLERNGQAVLQFLRDNLEQGKRIVLWGVGSNGTKLLEYLAKQKVAIAAVTDRDTVRQGKVVNGYTIQNPDAIWEAADLVITASDSVLSELEDMTKRHKIAWMNLLALLYREEQEAFDNGI